LHTIKKKIITKDRGAPKSAGPVAIATFATIAHPALVRDQTTCILIFWWLRSSTIVRLFVEKHLKLPDILQKSTFCHLGKFKRVKVGHLDTK